MDNSNMIQRIEIRLKEMGKSKSEFYKETGISSATYSQWNTGQFGPSKRKLKAISAYTGIPISDLTGEEQKESPPQSGELPRETLLEIVKNTDDDALLLEIMSAVAARMKERSERK